MAGGQERILRRRISSIDATKKITRAMELIAASRIVKAQGRVRSAKPYSEKVTDVIANLAGGGAGVDHPLLTQADQVNRVAYVVIAADRGLCGGYNNNVLRAVERAIAADQAQGRQYVLVLSGKKAAGYFSFRGYEVHAAYEGFSDQPNYSDAKTMAESVAELFESGDVQQVRLAYTRFLSMGSQEVTVDQFMPLEASEIGADASENTAGGGYEFEPEPAEILSRLLPRYVEARLYAALLEGSASEHAARQRAMKAATDNAEDLKTNLTRIMNRARQETITTEIMEIVSGSEAMSDDGDHDLDDAITQSLEGSLAALVSDRSDA
ncbi:MAG: F0F1 ATP synthase subunit gamma [Actinomycetota bacterium]|nr:F0F1 ATP synthase subunit gamma [Acidimicrobiaceae bacterium]MCS5673627.1 F0F1 ATP synthase subunit gamma [Acidimicrobiales bacterium]MED5541982.1 F0F1 ATP synthase subunit gamma [Actinomycetota bacterium]|tara:strand:+ start:1591 stop:2562 length:972 start_codon:yes stop_codon:yes gene_type:complete